MCLLPRYSCTLSCDFINSYTTCHRVHACIPSDDDWRGKWTSFFFSRQQRSASPAVAGNGVILSALTEDVDTSAGRARRRWIVTGVVARGATRPAGNLCGERSTGRNVLRSRLLWRTAWVCLLISSSDRCAGLWRSTAGRCRQIMELTSSAVILYCRRCRCRRSGVWNANETRCIGDHSCSGNDGLISPFVFTFVTSVLEISYFTTVIQCFSNNNYYCILHGKLMDRRSKQKKIIKRNWACWIEKRSSIVFFSQTGCRNTTTASLYLMRWQPV